MPPNQPIGRAAQAALLTWVNTFALDRRVDRLEDLADGHVFAQMLHDFDVDYDPAELEQNAGSSAWLTNKRNIQAIFKALTKYCIHTDTSGAIDFLPRTVDVRSIAANLNAEGLAQLVALFATAAMLGSHNTRFIPVMRDSLTTGEQAEIMALLQRKDEERQRLADDAAAAAADTALMHDAAATLDPGLVAEAQLATLATDYDRVTKRLADTNTRLEHLQISYEQIKDELERKEKELDLERQKYGTSESQLVRGLRDKLREQDELIASQEAQAEDDRQVKQRLAQENAQMARSAALVEPLQDQVQELKHANDELSKKANTVDRYKQKLEAQRGLEKDLQNALYELSQNKEALKNVDAIQKRATQQAATIDRFREMVSTLEQQIEEHRLQKTALEGDLYAAHVQLESFKEQTQLGEARISELEQQVIGGRGSGSGDGDADDALLATSPGMDQGMRLASSLEDELQSTAADGTQPGAGYQSLEVARLRAENTLLRNNVSVGGENDRLRADLEMAKAREELARNKHDALYEQHAVLAAQMEALTGGGGGTTGSLTATVGEGGALFLDVQRRLRETTAERDRQQATAHELERSLADRQREVMRLQGELGALDEAADASARLDALRTTDKLLSESLKTELDSLRRDFRALQLDNEQQQKQLLDALVSKEELRKTLGSAGGKDAATAEAEPSQNDRESLPTTTTTVLEEQLRQAAEKNDKLRTGMKQLKKQYDTLEQEHVDARRKLKELSSAGMAGATAATATTVTTATPAAVLAAQKKLAAQEQVIRNLQRENAMITTAWYDLTSRLQSNHVVLQRGRTDVPKSWLNKQRQMVNATPRR